MAATTGYQAGAESNDALVSYTTETVWANTPAAQFQALRITGESLTSSKSRQRPAEINGSGEVSQAVTTRETAGGALNYALSFGTYDDLLSVLLGADWQAFQAINGAAADITITRVDAATATLSSGTANKFATINAGQWVRLGGFGNAVTNNPMRVAAKPNAQTLTLATPLGGVTTETPAGAAAKLRASTLVNGQAFKSLSIQKRLGNGLYFRYPGSFITAGTLGGSVGGSMTGNFTVLAQSETKAVADWSTGAVLAAPTGPVHDGCAGFGGMFVNDVPLAAGLNSLSLNLTRQGANAEYAMGSAVAQGMVRGLLEVTGTAEIFFRSFSEYDQYRAEALNRLAFITRDALGNAYVITLLAGALLNPQIVAGGPSTSVLARYQIEANPQAAGGTIQIDRLVAA